MMNIISEKINLEKMIDIISFSSVSFVKKRKKKKKETSSTNYRGVVGVLSN